MFNLEILCFHGGLIKIAFEKIAFEKIASKGQNIPKCRSMNDDVSHGKHAEKLLICCS